MCRPQCGQVQKERRQSLYRSVSLYNRGKLSGPLPQWLDPPSPWGIKCGRGCQLGLELPTTHARAASDLAHREAVVGEIIRDSVAPLGGVWGQGRISKETGETRGGRDGLRSHIEVLGFQTSEPSEAVGDLQKGRVKQSCSGHPQEPALPKALPWTLPKPLPTCSQTFVGPVAPPATLPSLTLSASS